MYSDLDDKKPMQLGFGDLTPQQLGMKVDSSPFYTPPEEPEPEATTDAELEAEEAKVESEPKAGISDEIVSRATDLFESALRFVMDNPKLMGGISIVAVLSYMAGKRNLVGDRLKYQKEE